MNPGELSKKDLGINGVHSRLGLAVTEAEFRGYVIAKLQEQERIHQEMRQDLSDFKKHVETLKKEADETHSSLNKKISSLEEFKNKALGALILVPGLISLGVDWVLNNIR